MIVACDGTFIKSKFRQTLLFVVTIDGSNEVVILACTGLSVNEDIWSFFLKELKWYYSPYAKVLVKMSVRHLRNTTLQHKFIYYTTTTSRILFKIKLQSL